jgi:hypothetical protein
MTRLAITSVLLGAAIIAGRLPGVLVPGKYRAWARAFPRSVFWGRVLIGIAGLWAGIVMYRAATDDWAWARPVVVVGVPVAYWLVIHFGNQFLALRGTAAVSLLLAKVVLDVTDASEHPWRLVITTFAYLWVIAATWMAIAPHHFRDVINWGTATDRRCQTLCSFGVALGLALIFLGALVY